MDCEKCLRNSQYFSALKIFIVLTGFLFYLNSEVKAQNLTTVAGVLNDSTGTGNSIGAPNGVAIDSAGNIYVASTGATNGSTVYKITPGGVKSLYAGVYGVSGYNGDGAATSSQLNSPQKVWIDGSNNLYIADNANRLIRKVTPGGALTTVAGVLNDATGAGNSIGIPQSVAVDGSGNIYVAASGTTNGSTVYKITSGGVKSIYAGVFGTNGYNGDGAATSAQLNVPRDLSLDSANNLYIADNNNRLIRKVTPGGVLTTVAGVLNDTSGAGNSIGTPNGVAIDAAGNIYVAASGATNGSTVYKITPTGTKSLYAGVFGVSGYNGDGMATSSQLNTPQDVSVAANNLYIADNGNRLIRKVASVVTAASVSIGGQIITSRGKPVGRAFVTLINSSGESRQAISNPFGYFRFNDIAVGDTYVVSVRHKQYQFNPQVINVLENFDGLNFVAISYVGKVPF